MATLQAKGLATATINPAFVTPSRSSSGMGTLLLLVGLGVGGFLLYRHFKKAE